MVSQIPFHVELSFETGEVARLSAGRAGGLREVVDVEFGQLDILVESDGVVTPRKPVELDEIVRECD